LVFALFPTAARAGVLPENTGGSFGATILTTQHTEFQSGGFYFDDRAYAWLESTLRASGTWRLADSLTLSVGGVTAVTVDEDYYRHSDDILGVIDPLRFDLHLRDFQLTAGRQDFVIGDGFLVADGFNDELAARYSIPLKYWDGLSSRASFGAVQLAALAANLSGSFGYRGLSAQGQVYAGDVAWMHGPLDLGATGLARVDDGTADLDLRIVSGRGAYRLGRVTASGEYAHQGGKIQGVKASAYGYHADLQYAPRQDAFVRLRHARFSGDDPATAENEGFQSWHYGSLDWEQWYLGDIVGARYLLNANERAYSIDGAFAPAEGWTARLLLEYFDFDRSLPGRSRHFATESDFVLDYQPSEAWEFWFLFAAAAPGEGVPLPLGDKVTTEAFLNLTYRF